MPVFWNVSLVVLSVAVAIIGSFTALTHAQRMRESRGKPVLIWMTLGAITLGMAIWAMHFIGMLAFHLPIELHYDLELTLYSAAPAIAASLLGFYVLRNEIVSSQKLFLSGIFMGLGIAAMHYTGMAALKLSPAIHYSPGILLASVTIAIIASWGALMMMYQGQHMRLTPIWRFTLGSIVMGLAISGMHYTAMLGVDIAPNSVCLAGGSPLDKNVLVLLVGLTSMVWFGGGNIAAVFDQRIAQQNARALDQLKQTHAELERTATAKALEMTKELRNSEAKTRAVIEAANDCIISVDADGHIIEFNPAAESTFGHARNAVLGKNIAEVIIPAGYREKHREGMARLRKSGVPTIMGKRLELTAIRASGEEFPVEFSMSRFIQDGKPIYTAFLRDIAEQKQSEANIHSLAFYDPLTKLPNRRLLQDRVERALTSVIRHHLFAAILFIDLDNFKILNDTRGHSVGDLLLIEVAKRLTNCVRSDDTVTRLGGDEFVILLEGLSENPTKAAVNAELIAEKIRESLNLPYHLQGQEHLSSPSIGITLFQNQELGVEDLIKRADAAMYQAKRAGRNAIRFFDPEMQHALEARMTLENDLQHAIQLQQFELHYQPLVDQQQKILGVEALLRWRHPVRGLMLPAQFIPLAEETGLILPLGKWLLEVACRQLKDWQKTATLAHLEIAVNISARQFRQLDFVQEILEIIQKTGAPADKLKFELTESILLESTTDAIDKMHTLRSKGVRFCLDDFGTGYSSLIYLKKLPFSQLKIDHSIIHDIHGHHHDDTVIKVILGIAASLGMDVIAEGVETAEQLDFLLKHGCRLYQGRLFGHPLPLDALEESIGMPRTAELF